MKQNRMEELQLPEGLRKLLRRLRRGGIIFHSLHLVFAGCAGGALFFHGGIPWAVTAFVLSVACKLTAALHIGRRYICAWKVAENPQIVYWAHSADGHEQAIDRLVTESLSITLHLNDGTQLDVSAVRGTGTSQAELQDIVSWLMKKNPSMRWGVFNNPVSPL
jgi:hypothetical protein